MNIPRILIAGTNSGSGKTTITMGIMAALVQRGLKVQPFKVGPDYIDPMFHTFVTGNDSRNLDSWMLEDDCAAYLFRRNASNADIAIIEGVMGLYDGLGGYSQQCSTAHVSKVINAPVVLVVNGEGMSLSIAALIKGFRDFDPDVKIEGIIINNIKNEHHYTLLKEIIEENIGVSVIGYLPKMSEFTLPSRHLGLIPSDEITDLKEKISFLAAQIEKTINIDVLMKIAANAESLVSKDITFNISKRNNDFKIAIARDKAFNFYYKDNFELLEMLGAKLVYFSPINDKQLPEGISGMYIGGGYPEVWAKQLQDNTSMREDIRKKLSEGLPAYAECGGLMYLSRSIKDKQGNVFEMTGIIPGNSEMTLALKRFGYVELEVTNDNIISSKGYKIRAHEFHYSVITVDADIPTCFKVGKHRRGKEDLVWQCGFKINNVVAGYPHLHFWGNTEFAENFVDSCIQYSASRDK